MSKRSTEEVELEEGDGQSPMTFENALTRNDLAVLWPSMYPAQSHVIEFYGHDSKKKKNELVYCFSNFYEHDPIPFVIPDCCWVKLMEACQSQKKKNKKEIIEKSSMMVDDEGLLIRTIPVTFSEKSIMLCKAAVMGDPESFVKIINAKKPSQAKQLGRQVQNFDEETWQSVLLTVAFEAVYQKFKVLGFESKEMIALMRTRDALLVEAAPGDRIWGIGRPIGHPDCQDPRRWGNGNVLGWALMRARDNLRNEQLHSRLSRERERKSPYTKKSQSK